MGPHLHLRVILLGGGALENLQFSDAAKKSETLPQFGGGILYEGICPDSSLSCPYWFGKMAWSWGMGCFGFLYENLRDTCC